MRFIFSCGCVIDLYLRCLCKISIYILPNVFETDLRRQYFVTIKFMSEVSARLIRAAENGPGDGYDDAEGGMPSKLMLVRPVAATIMDKTLGRYQSIQGDPRMVHEFLEVCGEELQSLLVSFYDTTIMEERARITEALGHQQSTLDSEGVALRSRQPQSLLSGSVLGQSARLGLADAISNSSVSVSGMQERDGRRDGPLLPQECYTATNSDTEIAERQLVSQGAISLTELRAQKRLTKERVIDAHVETILAEGERVRREKQIAKEALRPRSKVPSGRSERLTSPGSPVSVSPVPPLRFPTQQSSVGIAGQACSQQQGEPHDVSRARSVSLSLSLAGAGLPAPGAQQQQQFHTLTAQIDGLQASLDVARSEQNFLRSIASDVIRDLEGRDVTINALKGALERREGVINDQRRAYMSELLHLKEMVRQYREKGRCDMPDATLYSWDSSAVQRFQEDEMRAKIDAAVIETRRNGQLERDAMEATFKKQMDDLRRRMAAMSEAQHKGISQSSNNNNINDTHRSVMLDGSARTDRELFELDGTMSSPPHDLSAEDDVGVLHTGRPHRDNGVSHGGADSHADGRGSPFRVVSIGGGSIPINDAVTLGEDHTTVMGEPSDAGRSTSRMSDYGGTAALDGSTGERATGLSPVVKRASSSPGPGNTLSYLQTKPKRPDGGAETLEDNSKCPRVPLRSEAFGSVAQTTPNQPPNAGDTVAHRGAEGVAAISTPAHANWDATANELALQNRVDALEERLKQRDAMIGRLRLLVKTAADHAAVLPPLQSTTDSTPDAMGADGFLRSNGASSIGEELAMLDEADTTRRRQESLQDRLMMPPVRVAASQGLEGLEDEVDRGAEGSPLPNRQLAPNKSGSAGRPPSSGAKRTSTLMAATASTTNKLGAKRDDNLTVAFGLSTHAPHKPTNTDYAAITTDLHRQIFVLQKQLANVTVGYEELCVKSKRWFDVYREQQAHKALHGERAAAEQKLHSAVTVAEAAEERFRIQGWKVMRSALTFRTCIDNQRKERREAEVTASYRTQQMLDRQLEILERRLSHKLLWMRQQHQDTREEANEAWDLVLIYAKAVARAVIVDDGGPREGGTEGLDFARATISSSHKAARQAAPQNDVVERQLELHKEASAQRRQYSAAAQQRLIEKYAVATVVKRFLANTTTPHSAHNSAVVPPRPPTTMRMSAELTGGSHLSAAPASLSHKPGVSSRPVSAAVGRTDADGKVPRSASPCGSVKAYAEEDVDFSVPQPAVRSESDCIGQQLDPRGHLVVQREADRVDRVRQRSLQGSMKGLGVVERLVQRRMQAADLEALARREDSVGATVLGGEGSATLPQAPVRGKVPEGVSEKDERSAALDEKGNAIRVRGGGGSPSSLITPTRSEASASRPASRVPVESRTHRPSSASADKPADVSTSILQTAPLLPRPASASTSLSGSPSLRGMPRAGAGSRPQSAASSNTPSRTAAKFDVNTFKLLRPDQKRAELIHLMQHDQSVKDEEQRRSVGEVYAG